MRLEGLSLTSTQGVAEFKQSLPAGGVGGRFKGIFSTSLEQNAQGDSEPAFKVQFGSWL